VLTLFRKVKIRASQIRTTELGNGSGQKIRVQKNFLYTLDNRPPADPEQ